MKNILFSLLIALYALAAPALAREAVPIVNLENQTIAAGSGKTLTLDDVRRALRQAASVRSWTVEDTAPGQALATLMVRGKHTIKVDVTYTDKTISFKYRDSVNMKYGKNEEGKPVIHPFYMKWVDNLMADLRVELARL